MISHTSEIAGQLSSMHVQSHFFQCSGFGNSFFRLIIFFCLVNCGVTIVAGVTSRVGAEFLVLFLLITSPLPILHVIFVMLVFPCGIRFYY